MNSVSIDARAPLVAIAHYEEYAAAERAVDHLSDRHFPVENLTIVGCDLRMVERVLGRQNWGRATLAGAAGGGWFGLLVGLLFAIFATTTTGVLVLLAAGLVWGAAFGAAFGAFGYALTGGRRDFVSRSSIVPARYDLMVLEQHAEDARAGLATLR